MTKRGFTLLEVCLAVAMMATGVLSVVILYSMGFRETRQSREDVASAAYADAVMSPLVSALSSTNITWDAFEAIDSQPAANGWGAYINESDGTVKSGCDSMAKSVYENVMGQLSASGVSAGYPSSPSGLKAGLVVMHGDGASIVKIGFRATHTPAMLMSAPLYYTEVRFQGVGKNAQATSK